MKIIICGAGEVGSNIAKQLVYEENGYTTIDLNGDAEAEQPKTPR